MIDKSSKKTPARKAPRKPTKPRKDFPLGIHKGTGYWCRKVRGKVHYFGKVADDPKGTAALEQWLAVKDALIAGREPRAKSEDDLTVAALANEFLANKEQLRDSGELHARTFRGYYDTCQRVVTLFGRSRAVVDVRPQDFRTLREELSQSRGPVSLRNEMQRVRSLFKFGFDEGLLLAPIRFGQSFSLPKLTTIRREQEAHCNEHGHRMFEAHELRAILAEARQPLRAMVLLAANCAFGQSDLAHLPIRAVDLDSGWIDFARVKTAVRRRIPLWPETIAAIREWLPMRPKAKNPADAGLLFLTVRGARFVKTSERGASKDAIAQEFNKILRRLRLKRLRLSFYGMRHGFETIGGESQDQVGVDAVMGRLDRSMASHYRERISDERLRRVVEHVRAWLFGGDDPTDRVEQPEATTDAPPVEPVADDVPTLKLFAG